jgi:uncharacterized protein YgiB involved in biofilm formation
MPFSHALAGTAYSSRNIIQQYYNTKNYENACAEAATNAVKPAMAAMPEAPTKTGCRFNFSLGILLV